MHWSARIWQLYTNKTSFCENILRILPNATWPMPFWWFNAEKACSAFLDSALKLVPEWKCQKSSATLLPFSNVHRAHMEMLSCLHTPSSLREIVRRQITLWQSSKLNGEGTETLSTTMRGTEEEPFCRTTTLSLPVLWFCAHKLQVRLGVCFLTTHEASAHNTR